MSVAADKFGFFNGIMGLEQGNWANYWKDIIPDCVVGGQANELEVFAQADGMKVYVKTGQAMVDNHRVWITSQKELAIAASGSSSRTDLVVLRIVYGNEGESTAVLDVKQGTTALTQTTGGTYEIPLAEVTVGAGVVTIQASAVKDRRVIHCDPNGPQSFSASPVTPLSDREYRCTTSLGSLTVNLPDSPQWNFITSVRFPSNSSFTGVTVKKGTTTISGTSNLKLKGDALNLKSKTYELVFWWDGSVYWCASAAA